MKNHELHLLVSISVAALTAGCPDDGSPLSDAAEDGGLDAAADTADANDSGDSGDAADSSSQPSVAMCEEECNDDSACLIGGGDIDATCENHRCAFASFSSTCDDDSMCVATLSGWTMSCTGDGDCTDGFSDTCVDIGGEGVCAHEEATEPCETFTLFPLEITEYGPVSPATVTVCGMPARCADHHCVNACDSDKHCQMQYGTPHCDTGERTCVCQSDTDCESASVGSRCIDGICRCGSDDDCVGPASLGRGHCNADSGLCECEDDIDCEGAEYEVGDICEDGYCGCSSVTACTGDRTFDGTSWVCE